MEAARLLRRGRLSQAEIARRMGVSRASVTRWKQRLEQEGIRGLRARPHPGRPCKLSEEQGQRLLQILEKGARARGFPTERWTLQRIAEVIWREFGARYHPRSLGPDFRARGWSPQRPVPRARERDEALVEAWLKHDWPRIKKTLAEGGVQLPSWTRRVTRFGPDWGLPGPPLDTLPSSGASAREGK
jgi:putative transposase